MKKTAIFLDRDGVINLYPGDGKYVTSREEFRFLPKVKEAIALLNSHQYPIFIISNQAGVGKGLYSQRDLDRITEYMLKELSRHKAKVNAVYYCIHRQEDDCPCRKPKAGLIEAALRNFNAGAEQVVLRNSFFVGDTIRDVQTARAAGCHSILIFCGREKPANRDSWPIQPDYVFPDLYRAARFIVNQKTDL